MTLNELSFQISHCASPDLREALYAVVKLHEPGDYGHNSWQACMACSCQECNTVIVWPCATIQAIEEKLR